MRSGKRNFYVSFKWYKIVRSDQYGFGWKNEFGRVNIGDSFSGLKNLLNAIVSVERCDGVPLGLSGPVYYGTYINF